MHKLKASEKEVESLQSRLIKGAMDKFEADASRQADAAETPAGNAMEVRAHFLETRGLMPRSFNSTSPPTHLLHPRADTSLASASKCGVFLTPRVAVNLRPASSQAARKLKTRATHDGSTLKPLLLQADGRAGKEGKLATLTRALKACFFPLPHTPPTHPPHPISNDPTIHPTHNNPALAHIRLAPLHTLPPRDCLASHSLH